MTPSLWRTLGEQAEVWPGRNWPLGATWSPESTNFAVHAPNATGVWLCVALDGPGEAERRYALSEQSLGIWHGALPGIAPGTRYGYRVDGPDAPEEGMRFDSSVLLLDPYALAVSGEAGSAWSVVVDPSFDWQGDSPIRRRFLDTVIYEPARQGLHAVCTTGSPRRCAAPTPASATPSSPTTCATSASPRSSLLPVHQFFSEPALVERGTVNYWGYNSIGYFAPHAAYAASGDRGQQVAEFKEMVRSLHTAGIEVILDVVYNHTAEAGPDGPTYSFRGYDDCGFYRRIPPGTSHEFDDTYWDVTGCGNTVNTEDPLALRLILDSLRYWVTEMHVDGFRFDLMSALTRTAGTNVVPVDMACQPAHRHRPGPRAAAREG
ncbi:alpha-amylase family glycosyl hydrolase [Nocardioides convexus]|uniref:alpha-amylase family glycosyl hydrolase n=1 Tax=Nocardioides convexus TaxID=2712224 RepID=UPI00241864CC|nr:alpha-amylase family glycosyl hydrolase [Nocardioides convexus]